MSGTQYELSLDLFNTRFKSLQQMQDIFFRDYTICTDEATQRKVIIKKYFIDSEEQQ